jgi:REP element-mobilizing transposase RayT
MAFSNLRDGAAPDHLHAVLQLPENDADFSTCINVIKTLFSKRVEVNGEAVSASQMRPARARHLAALDL